MEAYFFPDSSFSLLDFVIFRHLLISFRGKLLSNENGHHEYELHTGRYMYGTSNVLL